MKSEKEIVEMIIELEKELFDEECYLDEGQQSRLFTLYEILDRDLNEEENNILEEKREEMKEEYL